MSKKESAYALEWCTKVKNPLDPFIDNEEVIYHEDLKSQTYEDAIEEAKKFIQELYRTDESLDRVKHFVVLNMKHFRPKDNE